MISIIKRKLLLNKEVKNATWIVVCRIVRMIIAFIISIITARYLGPANFGLINYGTALVSFFTSLCTLGISSVIIKDFFQHPNEQGCAIGTSILFRILSSVASVVMIAVLVSYTDRGERLTIQVVLLCSLALVFQSIDTLNSWFQSKYMSKFSSIAALIGYTLASVYKVYLFVTNASVLFFAFATSVDYIFEAIVLLYCYHKQHGPKLRINAGVGKRILSQSYHYIISGMMVAIYGHTDKFMLKQMLDETAVGYYSLAATITTMWVFVLQAIIDSMYPTIIRLYNEDTERFNRKNIQLYSIIIYVSMFVSILFVFFGKFGIGVLYGDEYMPSASILNIITWYTVFSYLGVARNAWIVSNNMQKYLKYMYMTAVVVNIVLNYLLIPPLGAYGAALASLITQICTSIVIPAFIHDMRPNVKLIVQAFLLKGFR